jgi:putative flippase GtrA
MKSKVILFCTALAQVLFVTLSTYLIAKEKMVPAILSAFMINIIWTFNVKRIAFSDWRDRICYAVGACSGTAIGFWLGKLLIKHL